MAAVVRQLAAGMGDIDRHRPPVTEVFPGANGHRSIARRQLRTAVERVTIGQTGNQRALGEERRVLIAVTAAVIPGHEVILPATFTLQQRHGGVRHGIALLAAVLLFYGHFQIAA